MHIFKVIAELITDTGFLDNDAKNRLDQEFNGYGYMKRVYGIEHMPDIATVVKLSITDTLTKAYNRLAFESFLEGEIAQSRRYKAPLSLVIIDIAGFKKINREYGNLTGNFILIELANLLKSRIRVTDMLFRWNGDQFLIIVPHTNLEGVKVMIDKIGESIRDFEFNSVNNISCNFAYIEYSNESDTYEFIHKLESELDRVKSTQNNSIENS